MLGGAIGGFWSLVYESKRQCWSNNGTDSILVRDVLDLLGGWESVSSDLERCDGMLYRVGAVLCAAVSRVARQFPRLNVDIVSAVYVVSVDLD